jgi:methyl-accepting chemotaxis protein
MKISRRLTLGFGLNLVFLAVVGGLGLYETSHIAAINNHLIAVDARLANDSQRLRVDINTMRRFEKDAFLNIADEKAVRDYEAQWQEVRDHTRHLLEEMNRLETTPEGLGNLAGITKSLADYDTGFKGVLARIHAGKLTTPKAANEAIMPIKVSIHGAEDAINLGTARKDQALARMDQEVQDTIRTVKLVMVSSLLLALVVSGLLVAGLLHSIRKPLEAIEILVVDIGQGEGDLSRRLSYRGKDELGSICGGFNLFMQHLNRIIGMVAEVTAELYVQADSIAGAVSLQSASSAELSSSVAEIASTMEELSSSASQVAQHSHGVVARADETLSETRIGAGEVDNLTTKINDISEDIQANLVAIAELGNKSKEINKIMAIINNIASQTKLIAFNAALEAASAGETGKRFGVVALEIRRLADNVVESTAEIEGRITEILDTVNRLVMASEKTTGRIVEGQEYARHTVHVLNSVVEKVEESTDAARQISLSTQQQQIASNQVVLAIKDIVQGARHSTEAIRKMNLVTGEVSKLAGELKALVTTFKLDAPSPAPASGAAPAPEQG